MPTVRCAPVLHRTPCWLAALTSCLGVGCLEHSSGFLLAALASCLVKHHPEKRRQNVRSPGKLEKGRQGLGRRVGWTQRVAGRERAGGPEGLEVEGKATWRARNQCRLSTLGRRPRRSSSPCHRTPLLCLQSPC